MAEYKFAPLNVNPQFEKISRLTRNSWQDVGVDNFTKPPAQNPDMFMVLTNILPPVTGVLLRRWGYRLFDPKIDAGANIADDEYPAGE